MQSHSDKEQRRERTSEDDFLLFSVVSLSLYLSLSIIPKYIIVALYVIALLNRVWGPDAQVKKTCLIIHLWDQLPNNIHHLDNPSATSGISIKKSTNHPASQPLD